MDTLKLCPFCGGTAEIKRYSPKFAGAYARTKVVVQCTRCHCNSGEWKRTDKAIEAWNRRFKGETD